MTTRNKFSPEARARAVRMVCEHRADYGSEWAATTPIWSHDSNETASGTPETLHCNGFDLDLAGHYLEQSGVAPASGQSAAPIPVARRQIRSAEPTAGSDGLLLACERQQC